MCLAAYLGCNGRLFENPGWLAESEALTDPSDTNTPHMKSPTHRSSPVLTTSRNNKNPNIHMHSIATWKYLFRRSSAISSWLVDTCVSRNAGRRSLLNLNVSRGDTGSHIYMQHVWLLNTSLSHMPFKRYCSLCLFGKHLFRDVTFSADNDPDLCIPFVKISPSDCAPLKINAVTTAAAHKRISRLNPEVCVRFISCAETDWGVIKVFICFTRTSRYIWHHLTPTGVFTFSKVSLSETFS